jgi:hypothetical protein
MELVYKCPKCDAVLNPNQRVILVARRGTKQGLMLLSPRLGDYEFLCEEKLNGIIQDGDQVDFLCPACHESLASPSVEGFTEIRTLDKARPDRKPMIVRFSCVCNEHATFVYDEDSVKKYGKDAEQHVASMRIDGVWGW